MSALVAPVQQKFWPWLMALLLVTIPTSLAWQLYRSWTLLHQDEKTEVSTVANHSNSNTMAEVAVQALNGKLFGEYNPVPVSTILLEPMTPAPAITTSYTLQAIYYSQHRELSAISIVSGQKDNLFWETDELAPGVTIEQIAPDHVLLKRNGRLEQLLFDTASQRQPLPAPVITTPAQPGNKASDKPEARQQKLQTRLQQLRDRLDKTSG